MLLKACLNGARRPGEHPSLPVTAAELAADAAAAASAGAEAVHVHVKDGQGRDTFSSAELARVLDAIAVAAPELPVGVTTGAWALPDPAARVAAIRGWEQLPAFASVNWHEDGADEVAQALLDRGVGVEAGLWHGDAVELWAASPVRDRCCRILVELPDELDEEGTRSQARALLDRVGDVVPAATIPVVLHGEGTSCWPALRYAGEHRLATRIGLEDTLVLPDGRPAPDNEALVREAMGILLNDGSGTARRD